MAWVRRIEGTCQSLGFNDKTLAANVLVHRAKAGRVAVDRDVAGKDETGRTKVWQSMRRVSHQP